METFQTRMTPLVSATIVDGSSAAASILFTAGSALFMPAFEIGHSRTGMILWLSRLK
jgi:hypothetical protein